MQAQQLFDRARHERGIVDQSLQLPRVLKQRADAVAQDAGGRHMTGGEEEDAVGEQVIEIDRRQAVAGRDQFAQQRVIGRAEEIVEDAVEVFPHVENGPAAIQVIADRRRERDHRSENIRPAFEFGHVFMGEA